MKTSLKKQFPFLLMLLPGVFVLIINNYIPMIGVVMAFERYRFKDNFITSLLTSEFVGFQNFEFLFKTPNAATATFNTVFYNLIFIALGLIVPVMLAIALNEVKKKFLGKLYQSLIFLPYFLSWIVVSYLAYSFFSSERGFINTAILTPLGLDTINWYFEPKYWRVILIFFWLWKYTGYNMVVYLAAIAGIDGEYYEAASIDGATKWQSIIHITIPLLRPLMIILTLLAVGRIFNADFGLFYNVPKNMGTLYEVTDVIDTLVFRSLRNMNNVGMSSAAGLYQAVLGCITIFTVNLIVRKIDKDKALF